MSLLKPHSVVRGCRPLLRLFSTNFAKLQITQEDTAAVSERPLVPEIVRSPHHTVSRTLPYVNLSNPELERLRIVPALTTYFGGNPYHDKIMSRLNGLIEKHHRLPKRLAESGENKEFHFITFEQYKERAQSGTRLKLVHYKEFILALNQLKNIESELMPHDVIETLGEFTQTSNVESKKAQKFIKTLDEFGRANTTGKRKDAVAKISMVRGEGLIIVNGKPITEYFTRVIDRSKLVYPFQVVAQESNYNIFIKCSGGGVSGQAEACMYGIAKALVVFNPLLKKRLRKAGLMTRDNRIVERKKPGKLKARKSPTWVKR